MILAVTCNCQRILTYITPVTAGAPPRNGTLVMSTSAMALNNSTGIPPMNSEVGQIVAIFWTA
jgi:hypothetical protein